MTRQQPAGELKPRDDRRLHRRHIRIGLVGMAVAVVVALVVVLVDVVAFGDTEHRAEFSTSGLLKVGDEVRIAGIEVGEVRSVLVVENHVEVRFTTRSSVRLGDATTADIRLTTAVGGHYLAVRPRGSEPLGDHAIPEERTSVPYELSDVIDDSGQIVSKVDGATARRTFAQVTDALRGRPEAAQQIITEINTVATTLGDRDDDLDRAVAISEEYIGALNNGRSKLVGLLRLVGLLGYKVFAFRAEGVETVRSVAALFAFLEPPIAAFTSTIEPQLQKVLGAVRTIGSGMGRVGRLLDQLTQLANRLGSALGLVVPGARVDLSGTPVQARSLCIPSPDRKC